MIRKQSRLMSLTESLVNISIGLAVSLVANALILPLFFGVPVPLIDNLMMAGLYTGVSIIRSYAIRRLFEAIHWRKAT